MKINIDNFCIDDVFDMMKKLTNKIKKKKDKKKALENIQPEKTESYVIKIE